MGDTCCKTPYVYPKVNNPVPTPVINRLGGGMSDQERMKRALCPNTCKPRKTPVAYATGGQFRDSSFLTMKNSMQNAWQQSRGLGKPADNGCCTSALVSSDRTFTNSDLVAANTGAQICAANRFT